MAKSGADHLRSLEDGRCVPLDGGRVASVPHHDAFRNAARTIAGLYDYQAAPENIERMTFEAPTGRRVSRAWELPTSYDALVRRRHALTEWAELHHGFMGRSPDHVASTLSAMVMGPSQRLQNRHVTLPKKFEDY